MLDKEFADVPEYSWKRRGHGSCAAAPRRSWPSWTTARLNRLDPATGRPLGEPLEIGFVPIRDVQYADLDGDGEPEMLALGPGPTESAADAGGIREQAGPQAVGPDGHGSVRACRMAVNRGPIGRWSSIWTVTGDARSWFPTRADQARGWLSRRQDARRRIGADAMGPADAAGHQGRRSRGARSRPRPISIATALATW